MTNLSTMQETTTLVDLLKELREIRKKLDRIEEAIEDLIDSTLTLEEDELLEEVKEKIEKGDFSEFIPLEKLDEALEE